MTKVSRVTRTLSLSLFGICAGMTIGAMIAPPPEQYAMVGFAIVAAVFWAAVILGIVSAYTYNKQEAEIDMEKIDAGRQRPADDTE